MERLNLGCGSDYRREWVNVDIDGSVHPDKVVDLDDYPWPFEDNTFISVNAEHVFEHLENPLKAFREVARVLYDGGTLRWVYPIGHTRFEDITHKHYWNYNTPNHLVGDGKHSHETNLPFTILEKNLTWHTPYTPALLAVRLGERLYGEGVWIGDMPGVYGEVEVSLRYDG